MTPSELIDQHFNNPEEKKNLMTSIFIMNNELLLHKCKHEGEYAKHVCNAVYDMRRLYLCLAEN